MFNIPPGTLKGSTGPPGGTRGYRAEPIVYIYENRQKISGWALLNMRPTGSWTGCLPAAFLMKTPGELGADSSTHWWLKLTWRP